MYKIDSTKLQINISTMYHKTKQRKNKELGEEKKTR